MFSIHIRVANPQDQTRWRELKLVVDTGATLSKLSGDLLQDLHIEPQFSVPVVTSENRSFDRLRTPSRAEGLVTRAVGQAWVTLDGRAGVVPVAYGNRGEAVLLGATTLEILGFTVDPIAQKLLPRPLREK
jgi:hypothetical protein